VNTRTSYDIFGPGSNLSERYVSDHEKLKSMVDGLRKLLRNIKIVLTMGTFDILHIGHSRYLEKAKEYGDILIVGVDSDQKVARRKGPNRPVIPAEERREMLSHIRHVDLVTDKNENDPKWRLIKLVTPDVLVATAETYTDEELEKLKEFCGQVVVLEPQALTSTTAKLRRLHMKVAEEMKTGMEALIREAVEKASGKSS